MNEGSKKEDPNLGLVRWYITNEESIRRAAMTNQLAADVVEGLAAMRAKAPQEVSLAAWAEWLSTVARYREALRNPSTTSA